MHAIPPPLQKAFLEEIRARNGTQAQRRDWLKWLRYYLDFCLKYGHGPREPESLQPFLHKLAGKEQGKERRSPLDFPAEWGTSGKSEASDWRASCRPWSRVSFLKPDLRGAEEGRTKPGRGIFSDCRHGYQAPGRETRKCGAGGRS